MDRITALVVLVVVVLWFGSLIGLYIAKRDEAKRRIRNAAKRLQ